MFTLLIEMIALIVVMNLVSTTLLLRQWGWPRKLGFRLVMIAGLTLVLSAVARYSFSITVMAIDNRPEHWLVVLAWVTLLVLGFSIYLFMFEVVSLAVELVVGLFNWLYAWKIRRLSGFLAPLLAVLAIGYGYYAAGQLNTRHVTIETTKLASPLRVVGASDLHSGIVTPTGRILTMVETIQALKPDLVLFSGDILNDNPWMEGEAAEALASIKSTYGSYGVFGNHEKNTSPKASAIFFEDAGIKLLRDKTVNLGKNITVLGVDDPGILTKSSRLKTEKTIAKMAAQADPGRLNLMMVHRPLTWRKPDLGKGMDLIFSGHTHDGQIFPFQIVLLLSGQPLAGYYTQGQQPLIVSAGVGCWGPPIRILAQPDIWVIDFVPAAKDHTPRPD